MGRGVSGSECEYVVLEHPEKLSRIDAHGGCQTPHFVLAFTYAQTFHPQLFPAPDNLGAVVVDATLKNGSEA
jgi:hypothetical protein